MFAAFTQSLALVLTPMGLLSILGGVLCGIFVGVMPGLSSVMGMSIMLPVALSLVSGLKDTPVGEGILAFGEVGLAGEVRSVSNAEARVGEAARLGFTKVILPYHNLKSLQKRGDIELVGVRTVRDAYEALKP